MADTGNPNVYTTFQGRYSVTVPTGTTTSNLFVMLSNVNDVQFMGDFQRSGYIANSVLLTLPTECRPSAETWFICTVTETLGTVTDIAKIINDGTVRLQSAHIGAVTVRLRGTSFNISDNFY